jgi:hypothetical protein
MANIDIFNLESSGSELFDDSENFLADLDEQETNEVLGGYAYLTNIGVTVTVQTNVGNSRNANTIGNVNTVILY